VAAPTYCVLLVSWVWHGNCERQNRKIGGRAFPCLYAVSKKSSPFLFLWLLSQILTDLNIIAAEKICKQMTNEVKSGMVFIAGKTVWSMPERFKVVYIPCQALYKCSVFLTYSFLIISSLYMNITEQRNEIFCMVSMLPLRLAIVPFPCSCFQKFFSVPSVLNLYLEIP